MPAADQLIPSFDITEVHRREEAQQAFTALRSTLPMVAVHIDDLGELGNIFSVDSDRFSDNSAIVHPTESREITMLAKKAFSFFTDDLVVPLTHNGREKDSLTPNISHEVWLSADQNDGSRPLRAGIDSGVHLDRLQLQIKPVVYGCHITLDAKSSGEVVAGFTRHPWRAPMLIAEFGKRFGGPTTHHREFKTGDVHIFVRHPSKLPRSRTIVRPTRHGFTSGPGGRTFTVASYGLVREWLPSD